MIFLYSLLLQRLPLIIFLILYLQYSMIQSLLLLFLFHLTLQDCSQAQKDFFMSYDAMGKRDTISNLFGEINPQIQTYNYSYTDHKNYTYQISSMHPQMYYNDHNQNQKFIDQHAVKVSLGDIELAFRLNFTITKNEETVSGWGRGRTLVDQDGSFQKKIDLDEGILKFYPTNVTQLTVSYLLTFDHLNLTLDYEDKRVLENMLNDYVGEKNLKKTILSDFNKVYADSLTKHLNTQKIIQSLNFNYTYGFKAIHFKNAPREFGFENKQQKGLRVNLLLFIQNFTTNCSENTMKFESTYGGVQQAISYASMSEIWRYAVTQSGILNVSVDRMWDVPTFQFYMGDLATVVPEVSNAYTPTDSLFASCHWNGNEDQLLFSNYDNARKIYVQAGLVCTLKHYSKQLIKLSFLLTVVAQIDPLEDSLVFRATIVNPVSPKFEPIDPLFVVTDTALAQQFLKSVLKGMEGGRTFGSGWKTVSRKYPGVKLTEKYLLVFDVAQS